MKHRIDEIAYLFINFKLEKKQKKMSSWYSGSTLPTDRAPSTDQLLEMNEGWVQASVTGTNTVGTVGMFGF